MAATRKDCEIGWASCARLNDDRAPMVAGQGSKAGLGDFFKLSLQLGGGGGGGWSLCRLLTDIGNLWTHCPPPNCGPYYSGEQFASDFVIDRQNLFHEVVSGVLMAGVFFFRRNYNRSVKSRWIAGRDCTHTPESVFLSLYKRPKVKSPSPTVRFEESVVGDKECTSWQRGTELTCKGPERFLRTSGVS